MEFNSTMEDTFLQIIKKLPHSEGRVPYTYHHDYLRVNCEAFKGVSRSDVASTNSATKKELYATALIQICNGVSLIDSLDLGLIQSDFDTIREAKKVVDEYIKREHPLVF